jgi:hypothetical protein
MLTISYSCAAIHTCCSGCKRSVFMLFVRRGLTFYLDAEGSALILAFSFGV